MVNLRNLHEEYHVPAHWYEPQNMASAEFRSVLSKETVDMRTYPELHLPIDEPWRLYRQKKYLYEVEFLFSYDR